MMHKIPDPLIICALCGEKKIFHFFDWKSLQKKQRFEKMSLTWKNGHAVHAAGVADPFLDKKSGYGKISK